MSVRRVSLAVLVVAVVATAGGAPSAQGALAQLGLTEAAARNFVLTEATAASAGRRTVIAETGRRAFYKLPAAARGAAATALFAWAKAYANSPAFKASYAQRRRDVLGPERAAAESSLDAEVQQRLAEMKAAIAESRRALASLPPGTTGPMLASIAEQEAKVASAEFERTLREGLVAEREDRAGRDAVESKENDERYPADPSRIVARRLRQFLEATADVNFGARTLSLTGGVDGIEFLDKADRQRNWMWQEAVIAGPEATAAARAAADAWLKEIVP